MTPQIASAPPWFYNLDGEWVTCGEFAKRWNKNRKTIQRWCESGFMLTLGMSTYRDPQGYWYIHLPATSGTYAT